MNSFRDCVIVVIAITATGCTKHNPSVCCTTAEDCASIGFSDDAPCANGLVCVDFSCVAPCGNECSGSTPFCAADNTTCVGCVDSSQCSSGGVCDQTSHSCRACATDDDCESKVCALDGGMCVDETSVLYVAPAGTVNDECSQATPCTFDRALVLASATRATVRILPGQVVGDSTWAKASPLEIVGTGATLTTDPAHVGDPALSISSGATVSIRSLGLIQSGAGAVLQCSGSRLDLDDVSASGTISTICTGTLDHVTADTLVVGGMLTITSTKVTGTLSLFASPDLVTIVNSLIGSVASNTGTMTVSITYSTITHGISIPTTTKGVVAFHEAVLFQMAAVTDTVVCPAPCAGQFNNNVIFPQSTTLLGTNIVADPEFVDVENSDFHLRAGSPAIDADTSAVAPPPTDLDGTARPVGPHADLGAYEFH